MSHPFTIPDLWSDEINANVLTPLAILKAQAVPLSRRTKGILEVQVSSIKAERREQHHLELIAPAIGGYRERILTLEHEEGKVYPVTVKTAFAVSYPLKFYPASDSPIQEISIHLSANNRADRGEPAKQITVDSQEGFIEVLREALGARPTLSAIQSLIARSNEISYDEDFKPVANEEPGSSAVRLESVSASK